MPEVFNAQQPPSNSKKTVAESDIDTALAELEKSSPDVPHRHVDEYSEVMRKEEPTVNPFQAFAAKPLEVFFEAQAKEEHVVLLLRKHPITQIPWVLIAIGLLFFPFLLASIGFFNFLPPTYNLAVVVFWYLLVTGFSLESFLSWFFNVYIITDERVIDVDFLSLIYKNISSAKIDNIEDVTAETGGAIRSIFDFGTVTIQTAGATAQFDFEDVPHPAKVTRLLNELILEEEREKIEGRVS